MLHDYNLYIVVYQDPWLPGSGSRCHPSQVHVTPSMGHPCFRNGSKTLPAWLHFWARLKGISSLPLPAMNTAHTPHNNARKYPGIFWRESMCPESFPASYIHALCVAWHLESGPSLLSTAILQKFIMKFNIAESSCTHLCVATGILWIASHMHDNQDSLHAVLLMVRLVD